MKALSLFNGISALHLALDRAEIKASQVYYAEIDKYANKITEKHYPNDVALGDVTKWREWNIDWADIGLVGAGFPCQAWSVAGKQLGDKDERGMLFWTTLEIIAHVLKHNPKAKFLMENVKMKKDFEQYITHHTEQALGHVEKTLINSALVSAQNRQRYYWTNFEVTQPDDKGILLKDVLEYPMDDKYKLSDEAIARFKPCQKTSSGQIGTTAHEGKIGQRDRVYDADGKMVTLTATIYKQPPQYAVSEIKKVTNVNPSGQGMNGNVYHTDAKSPTLTTNKGEGIKITGDTIRPASIVGRRLNERGVRDDYNKDVAITQCLQVKHKNEKTGCLTTVDKDNVLSQAKPGRYPDIYNRDDVHYRKLTPIECERLQTFCDGWTDSISNTQRYKALGNAWTVDVIVHILKCAF